MRRSARKAAVISGEIHTANVHIGNVGRTIHGKSLRQPTPTGHKGALYIVHSGFLGLASTFERLTLATAKLRGKIPDLDRGKAQGRESIRGKIKNIKQQSAPAKERHTTEVEI